MDVMMLVLTRKRGESVEIGEGFFVTVTEIRGNRVRLGFHGDDKIKVKRAVLLPKSRAAEDSGGK
jgi:carbon storage regulator